MPQLQVGPLRSHLVGTQQGHACNRIAVKPLLPRGPAGRRHKLPPTNALHEALGADATVAAADMILKVALQDASSSHHAGSFVHTLHHAVHGSSFLFHPAQPALHQQAVDAAEALSAHMDAATAAVAATATASPLAELGAAAVPALADIGTSPAVHHAASAAIDTSAATLLALGQWATENLRAVEAVDPHSHSILSSSVDSVLTALREALDSQAASEAQAWTGALVMGVQQLMSTTLDTPVAAFVADGAAAAAAAAPGSGVAPLPAAASLASIVAAQEAMVTALTQRLPGQMLSQQGAIPFVMALLALVVACIPRSFDTPSQQPAAAGADGEDLPPLRYDPAALDAYWGKKPLPVMRRMSEVAGNLSVFAVNILVDWRTGKWDENMVQRAQEFRIIVENLGAAYIKIAQQLSTRVDLVPEPYLAEFRRLQDNVKTFSTEEARVVLEQGLGQPVDDVFEWLSSEPVAAASLGQVYKGRLREGLGGGDVAVKVQRPGVLESVSLDIFIMRRAALLMAAMPFMSDRWANVLDDWGTRFFEELDYQLEAYNSMTFKKQMAALQGITVAMVYPELTSRKIIITDWVVGEKLTDSRAEDVRALCSTLLNCYLIQLLETGLLHADPHPGNLLRTPDGRIVILDFGLMTEVSEDQRVALVEFIAHLTMEDWDSLAQDLVHLGFMPGGLTEDAKQQIIPLMSNVMGTLLKGGGLRGFNVGAIMGLLEKVQADFEVCMPGYFMLVLRAFCVIEGIALKTDPNYAIVQECLPYLSRRLLTDNNPRMRAALRQLLYGNSNRLDVERLSRMMSAFGAFTTNASVGADSQAAGPTFASAIERVKGRPAREDPPVVNEAMKEALKVVFSKNGSYAQELVVEELVAAVDAMSREALGEALRMVATSAGAVAALRSYEALGPLRTMIMPLPLPIERFTAAQPERLLSLSADDRQALAMVRTLLDLVQPQLMRAPDVASQSRTAMRAAGELMPLVPDLLPGVQATAELFVRQLVRRMALRLAEDLELSAQQALPAAVPLRTPVSMQQPHHHQHHHHGHQHHRGGAGGSGVATSARAAATATQQQGGKAPGVGSSSISMVKPPPSNRR